jgi:hypothetical protein
MNQHTRITAESARKANQFDESLEPRGEFATSIRLFRSAVDHVAQRETSRPVAANWLAPALHRKKVAHRRIVLSWVCAAVLCFAALPISIHLLETTPVSTQQDANLTNDKADTALTDTALLEQVDSEVSESVPASLAPLATLDSWDATTSSTETSLNTERKNAQ